MLLEAPPLPEHSQAPLRRPSADALWRLAIIANLVAIVGLAIGFRLWKLGSMPGINGDEAWIGVQAQLWLRGEAIAWKTPTGNPLNLFFFLPQVVAHACFEPSFTLLRVSAVISGLLALAVNYGWCRRHFGRTNAVVSTVLLAVLPINIAYSRFAWDACQSLLASLVVFYMTMEVLRSPECRVGRSFGLLMALAAAVLVHPTNIFLAPMALVPCAWVWRTKIQSLASRCRQWPWMLLAALCIALAAVAIYSVAGRWLLVAMQRAMYPEAIGPFVLNCARLFSGTTVYQFIVGTHSSAGWLMVDITVAAGLATALFMLWRRSKQDGNRSPSWLLTGWMLSLAAFFLIAGPDAMTPHFERYAMWMIGPTCLLLTLTVSPLFEGGIPQRRTAQLLGIGLAWCSLLDFNASYFQRFATTGGDSHPAFHTADVEPKLAAFEHIQHTSPAASPARPVWIIADEWWNYWPMLYLSLSRDEVRVSRWPDAVAQAGFDDALRDGRVWGVAFAASPESAALRQQLSNADCQFHESTINGPRGRAILTLLQTMAEDAATYRHTQ